MGVPNTQRKYKDKLFVSLFKEKEELLALYNAVNGSDYEDPEDMPALECIATVVNINLGKNQELMERCKTLYGYSYLVAEIRANLERNWPISEAIDEAVKKCIENGVLVEYLTEHRAEVCEMIMTTYNEELHNRTLREDGRAAGRLEGEDNMSILYKALEKENRLEDFGKSLYDKSFLEELKKEFSEHLVFQDK